MRSNVAPFLWFVTAAIFFVVWSGQHKTVYLVLAIVFAIFGARSYAAMKRA